MTSSNTATPASDPAPGPHLCLGLTGRMASGKGEVVRILQEKGFRIISLSDIVREEAQKCGRELTRSEMQDLGNRLRREGGAGVLGRRVREKICAETTLHWVIDGIRNPAEVRELRDLPGFLLLAVDATLETILERMQSRGRSTDVADPAELRRRLDREWGIGEPEGGQQVGPCMALADLRLDNNGGLDELQAQIEALLERLLGAGAAIAR